MAERRLQYRYRDYPCKGEWLDVYETVPTPQTYVGQRARSSRVKPALYFLSPTAQPLVYTTNMVYGRRQDTGTPYPETVSGACTKPGQPWSHVRTLEERYDSYPLYPSVTSLAAYLNLDRFEPWQNKVRDRVADMFVNVGEDVVQWKQTVTGYQAFTQSAGDAWRAYKAARRGRFKSAWELAQKSAAGSVLGWDFGVAPTLGSIHDSIQKLKELRENPPWEKISVFQTASDSKRVGLGGEAYSLIRGTKTRRYTFYARKTGVNQTVWTLGNPLELAWNLTPFSWVVDYAIGVGDYLTRLGALSGVTLSDGSVSEKTFYNATQFSPSGVWKVMSPATGTYESHVRSVILSGSIPSPKMDWWKFDPRWNNLADTVAVWTQIRK